MNESVGRGMDACPFGTGMQKITRIIEFTSIFLRSSCLIGSRSVCGF